MNLPNIITVVRIFAVPLVIWLILGGHVLAAFWVFVAAGISDGVDGYLARKWDQRTELGAYLDPVADKALLVSIYVTLAMSDPSMPSWLAILVVSRDVMIVSAVILSWLMERPLIIRPLAISKLNTVAQIVFAALALGTAAYRIEAGDLMNVAALVTGILTLLSAAAYLAAWMRHMAEPKLPQSSDPPRPLE